MKCTKCVLVPTKEIPTYMLQYVVSLGYVFSFMMFYFLYTERVMLSIMSCKCKCTVIITSKKLEAVKRVNNGEVMCNVATDFDVGIKQFQVGLNVKKNLNNY